MSGHSKWHTIKHKKGLADSKRGQAFTKIIKEIIVAARTGGGDPNLNAKLRTVILKAKSVNMPKDNVDRAIKKGTGELEGVEYTEMMYEAYAPGGVALLINILTDNKNRTASEIRHLLGRGGGNLGESGCVAYLFKRKGSIALDASKYSEDKVLEIALEAGADDVSTNEGIIEVTTNPESFESVLNALEAAGMQNDGAEISMVADTMIALDKDKTAKVMRLIEMLEEHDDVQSVASNLEVPDDYEPAE